MKSKQIRQTSRTRRISGTPSGSVAKQDQRSHQSLVSTPPIKQEETEDGNISIDANIFPGFLPLKEEFDTPERSLPAKDLLSLKGQVWPGMGKMDLADDEMKRTRNQRKPASVIDRMRKVSEGIDATQVVLTPEWQVASVKTVYDETPHNSDTEKEPTEKRTKAKRKASAPLAEISANVLRGGKASRGKGGRPRKVPKVKDAENTPRGKKSSTGSGPLRPTFDVFCDNTDGHSKATSTRTEPSFELRSRFALGGQSSNSLTPLGSPSPTPRDVHASVTGPRDHRPFRMQVPQSFGHATNVPLSSTNPNEASYVLHDASIYNNSSRIPLQSNGYYDFPTQDHLRFHAGAYPPVRYYNEEDMQSAARANGYLHLPSLNPLFTSDRWISNPYGSMMTHSNQTAVEYAPSNGMIHDYQRTENGAHPLPFFAGPSQHEDHRSTSAPQRDSTD